MKAAFVLREPVVKRARGRISGLMMALGLVGLSPMAVFGQPLDGLVGYIAIGLLVGGLIALGWGVFTFMTAKGKQKLMGGIAVTVISFIMLAAFGVPALQAGSFVTVTPPPGTWGVCLTNANFATIGLGTCPQTMVGSKAVLKSQTVPTANFRIYFNVTVTPPSGSTQVAYNVIVGTATPPSLSNTSAPQTTAPVLALLTGGQYDVVITPASGTATNQLQVVPITSGTSKVIAFQVHFSTIIGLLSLGQYPVGVNVVFTFVDQNSGVSYGSITQSVTFT